MKCDPGGVYWQRKDVILPLPTNVSLPTSLDHNTKTSPHGNDGHSAGEEDLNSFMSLATSSVIHDQLLSYGKTELFPNIYF